MQFILVLVLLYLSDSGNKLHLVFIEVYLVETRIVLNPQFQECIEIFKENVNVLHIQVIYQAFKNLDTPFFQE